MTELTLDGAGRRRYRTCRALPEGAASVACRRRGLELRGPISAERGLFAEGGVAEVVLGAVGAERVHEGAGLDLAVGAREGAAVDVPGAA
jgi:hypothetical protein